MKHPAIRKTLSFLEPTPFHPQWLAFRGAKKTCLWAGERAGGAVLDIGCAGFRLRRYLREDCRYIGLDYYATATALYGKKPHVYGDAQALPLQTASLDSVVLFDVLEHVPRPEDCIAEIGRVLKDGGRLLLQAPFLYPLHDEPFDFQRLTIHGLKNLLTGKGFRLIEAAPLGSPLATAALIANLALSKTVLAWFSRRSPLALLGLAAPFFILFTNLLAWALDRTVLADGTMPQGYRLLCVKEGADR